MALKNQSNNKRLLGFLGSPTTSPFRPGWIQISMLAVLIIAVLGAISNKQIRAFGK
jgi:hypothetical protein